jgi:glucose/arabinose dehydrogenase
MSCQFPGRVAASMIGVLSAAATLSGATLPPGFEDTLIATLTAPTAIAFTPDGRLLITTQPGQLFVYEHGTLLATPALDLAPVLCSNLERGLLGVAVDPGFAANGFIYLYYTFNKTGNCTLNIANGAVNRVSRFRLTSAHAIDRASELILIDNIPSRGGGHNAGDLQFGRDGNLYISVGDGGCDYSGDSGCAALNDAARDRHALVGKILRITPAGGIPPDNPFLGTGTVRCNLTGRTQPGLICQETFAWGLRNPFRMGFDPNAAGTRFFINDVGQNHWEEINDGIAGADYGWNVREGHCAAVSATDCGPPPPGMVNPIFDYQHRGTCSAITGAAFVPRGVWPLEFEGAYLFGDYTCGSLFRLTRTATGTYTRTTFVTGLEEGGPVAMIFGPSAGTQALYYTTYAAGGQVRRIAAVAGTNRSPIASAAASPRFGPTPLAVRFDASASTDPDGDPLTFEWDFNDGSPHGTTAIVTHTYATAGQFVARVTVGDGHGNTSTATVTISAGNTAPLPTISSPSATTTFAVGQTLTLRGSATDAEDGVLADARLTWEVLLHHNSHTHPYLQPTSGNAVTIQAPPPEDLAAAKTSFLEIRLTATDSQGATATIRRDVQPRLVNLTFDSAPAGLAVVVNNTTFTTPAAVTSWDGYQLAVSAASQKDAAQQAWLFSAWSDGGAAAHTVVTPAAAATYTAQFAAAAAFAPAADAYIRSGTFIAQNFGADPTLIVKHGDVLDQRRQSFVRFAIGSGTVGRAVLRLHGGLSAGAGDVPVSIHSVADTAWAEASLTWSTRPPRGITPLATTVVKGTSTTWHEWDVTSYVREERAAGRTAVGFVLLSVASTSPYAGFSSRNAASNRPELFVSGIAAQPVSRDVVLYAADGTRVAGGWQLVADTTAAGGLRMSEPDGGAPKLVTALAAPTSFFELTFNAEAGRAYRLWVRGKAVGNHFANDSAHIQFSGSVTSAGLATYRIGSTSSTAFVLEDCSGCGLSGWGWADNGYGKDGELLYFTAGPQTMRIQTREDGLSIDQIVLSPTTYLSRAPGTTKNDTTIVPK